MNVFSAIELKQPVLRSCVCLVVLFCLNSSLNDVPADDQEL